MKLLTLKLRNFQGCKSLDLDLDGKNAAIYGDNETGKTTVFNAFTWLLFDKPSTGAKNFSPKTRVGDKDEHGLFHTAEALFVTDVGLPFSVRKEYYEVYKKVRGSAKAEFSGHTTDYYVNDVPSTEKEYYEAVMMEVGDLETLKILVMPDYFPHTMAWTERRKTLLSVLGDCTDEEVFRSAEELSELKKILGIRTVEEQKKISENQRREINKSLEALPVRIDEASKMLPDIQGIFPDAINAQIAGMEADRDELAKGAAGSATAQIISDIKIRIAELNANLAEKRASYATACQKKNEAAYADLSSLNGAVLELDAEIRRYKISLEELKTQKEKTTNERTRLQAEWSAANSTKWDEGAEVCPTCGQALPTEKIEALREEFHRKKSETLARITQQGKETASADIISKLTTDIERAVAAIVDAETRRESAVAAVNEAKRKIAVSPAYETTPEYAEMTAKIKTENDSLEMVLAKGDADADELKTKIKNINEQIDARKAILALLDRHAMLTARINELKEQEKEYAKDYENCERIISLCELFTKQKVELLDNRINSCFSSVRFRLFQEQINGGIKEDCEVLVPSKEGNLIPYEFSNNAGKINAGLEITSVLSRIWQKSVPVFVDNAEAVTKLIPTEMQTIKLIVSEADKALRLEKEETTAEVMQGTAEF